jgi:hypothetical protein
MELRTCNDCKQSRDVSEFKRYKYVCSACISGRRKASLRAKAAEGITYIYALCEPNTMKVRYIGCAYNLKERLTGHISEAASGYGKSLKNIWIRSLLAKGLKPVLRVLERTTHEQCKQREIDWGLLAYEMGCDLVNDMGALGAGQMPHTDTRPHSSRWRDKVRFK